MSGTPGTAPGDELRAEQVMAINRALADPRRFAMLQQIATQDALPCSQLGVKGCLSPATISHHLRELQEAELVSVEREGRGMKLSLRREVWAAYLRFLATL